MEQLKEFLESSTVHGLVYIATTRHFSRLFWVAVVVCGFTVAGLMINQSVRDWKESPVSTSTETLDIANITFPPVIVCPPKVKRNSSSARHTLADKKPQKTVLKNAP